ncbi:MAG: glycosyltransferase [Paludibacteraceae bacterium]|nr:glycosyltransferase [Paludibacteraceae bacterium]
MTNEKSVVQNNIGCAPLISVIMAAYNAEQFISDSIESILSQTYKNWELIIIDDCSTDSTVEIVQSFHLDKIVLLQNETNSGPAFSRNRGLSVAKGEYIAILDSDDIALDNRFEMQISQFKANPDLVFSSGAASVIDQNGKDTNIVYSSPMNSMELKLNLLFRCPIIHSTVMLKAEFIREHSLSYDIEYPCNQDYKMWTDIVRYEGAQMKVDSMIYVKYRVSENQISTRKRDIQLIYGRKLRKLYMNHLEIHCTEDTLSVLSYLDSNNFDGSVAVCTCERVLMSLRDELKSAFPLNVIDRLVLDNLRFLYLKTSSHKIGASMKYMMAIINLRLFNRSVG